MPLLIFVFSAHLLLLTTPVLYLHVTKKHENIKKRAYGQRIREIKHISFTPVVLSATGALPMKPHFSINIWLLFCSTNGEMNIHL